jgi:hypothetical protein
MYSMIDTSLLFLFLVFEMCLFSTTSFIRSSKEDIISLFCRFLILEKDIYIPNYCYISFDENDEVDLNAYVLI